MIVAAIGGVGGNLPALRAVLDAIDEEGIERILCTGNIAAGAPWPNEVIEALDSRAIPCVQGDTDRRVVRFLRKHGTMRQSDDAEILEAAFNVLESSNLEWLRGLPKSMPLTIDGIDVYLCHGTPANPRETLAEDDDDQRYQRQREVCPAPIIIHGGTERPHVRTVDGTLFVNPGALGSNQARPGHAPYAVINTENEPWGAEIRWVACDVTSTG